MPTSVDIQSRARKTVRDALQEAELDRSTRAEYWLKYYNLYRGVFDFKTTYPYKSQLVPPIAFTLVETELPRLYDGLFGPNPYLRAKPQGADDAVIARETIEPLLMFQLESQMGLSDLAPDIFKAASIFGTAIVQVGWKKETAVIPQRVPKEVVGGVIQSLEEIEEVVYDGPVMEPVEIFDFWIDPGVKGRDGVQKARYCVRREHVSDEDVRDKIDSGEWTLPPNVKFKDLDQHGSNRSDGETGRNYDDERHSVLGKGNQGPIKGYHDVMTYWGVFAKTPDGRTKQMIVVLLNGDHVVRIADNPYGGWKPFIALPFTSDPTEFYGQGLIEVVYPLIVRGITILNQRTDNINLLLSPTLAIDDGMPKDYNELIYRRPGGLVRMDTSLGQLKDSFLPIPVENTVATSFQDEINNNSTIDRTSGQYDYTRGDMNTSLNETATGIVSIIGEANARFKHRITRFGSRFLVATADAVLRLDRMFLEDQTVIRIEGEAGLSWKQVNTTDIQRKYDFRAVPSPMMGDKNVRRQQLLTLFTSLAQNQLTAPWLKVWEHLRQLYSDYELPDTDTFIKSLEQFQQEQEVLAQEDDASVEAQNEAAQEAQLDDAAMGVTMQAITGEMEDERERRRGPEETGDKAGGSKRSSKSK